MAKETDPLFKARVTSKLEASASLILFAGALLIPPAIVPLTILGILGTVRTVQNLDKVEKIKKDEYTPPKNLFRRLLRP
ncbi:MAG TPA: hypothetical protein VF189_02690 [Patescibacteria group bacterium]